MSVGSTNEYNALNNFIFSIITPNMLMKANEMLISNSLPGTTGTPGTTEKSSSIVSIFILIFSIILSLILYFLQKKI